MDEVEKRAVGDACEQRGRCDQARTAPSDHREAGAAAHLDDPPWEQTEALVPAVLERFLEQQLVAEADAEHRLAGARQLDDPPAEPSLLEPGERRRERANAGEDDAVCARELVDITGQPSVGADRDEGALDRADVADAVVDDRDHPSSPFDDGVPRPVTVIASRRASPRALNVASTMWWRLRPRMRSTWIVAPRWIDSARQNSSSTSDSRVPMRPRTATL